MNQTLKSDTDLFTELVAAICIKPKELIVKVSDFSGIIFTLQPHAIDYGSVLGKNAKTLLALRVVASALMRRHDKDAEVALEPRERKGGKEREHFTPKPDWDKDTVERLALEVCGRLCGGKLHADWDQINNYMSGLLIIGDEELVTNQEQALGHILDCIAAKHGQHVRFRTEAAEEAR